MDSPLQYSKSRDVHSVGVLFLQMLVGWNVMEIYPSPKLALQSRQFFLFIYTFASDTPITASLSPLAIHHITNMLNSSKKNGLICQSVLQDMETSVRSPRPESKTTTIAIPSGMKYLLGFRTLSRFIIVSSEDTNVQEDFCGLA